MSKLSDEAIPKFYSGLRIGDDMRGQIFGNTSRQVKKMESGDDYGSNMDNTINSIQKSLDIQDRRIAFDINTFRGDGNETQGIKEISPILRGKRQPSINGIAHIHNGNILSAHDNIEEEQTAVQQKETSSAKSQQADVESNQQRLRGKSEIKSFSSSNDESPMSQQNNKNNININFRFNSDDQFRQQSQYSKMEKVIMPIGSAQKVPSEGNTPLARGITTKRKPLNETWRKKGLNILFHIKKFIMLLKNISSHNNFRSLNKDQFDIINDRANNYNYYKFHGFFVNVHTSFLDKLIFKSRHIAFIKSAHDYLLRNMIIIHPEHILKLIWDGFMLFLLVINIFYIPLKIAFEDNGGLQWPQMIVFFLNDVPGWAFLMDILLNFFTAYYKKGVIITDVKTISYYYFKNQFFFDIFVFLPFIISKYFQIKYLDSILLLRFNKILKIINNYLDLLNLKSDQAAIFDLLKLIVLILFIAHFCGCSFYLVAYIEIENGNSQSWLTKYFKIDNPSQSDWFPNYVASFYWAVITMITVGYGDITPTTTVERLFVIVICLLSCGVFAYSVNSIGSIIGAMTQKATNFKNKMSLLSIHMKKRGLSTELQMKVKKYFEYLNDEKLEDNQEGENMLKQLASSLKHEIAVDIYGKILNQKKIFSLNFSKPFLMDLAPKLKEMRLGPEEIIYNENEDQPKIYFLMKGNVNLFMEIKKSQKLPYTVLKTVSKNGVFGELGFFSGMASNHGAITTNVVSIIYITRDEFLDVIKLHPTDHEKYKFLKDNYTLYSSSRGLESQCYGCGKFTHQINHCTLLNYIPNKDQILENHRKQEDAIRTKWKREREKSESPWKTADGLKQNVVKLIIEIEGINDLEDLLYRLDEMEESNDEIGHQRGSESEEDEHSEDNRDTQTSKNTISNSYGGGGGGGGMMLKPEEINNDSELIKSIVRRGRRQQTYRKPTSSPLQSFVTKASIGPNQDGRKKISMVKKPSDVFEDSLGLNSEDPQPATTSLSYRELRANIKRATFIKKMSTRKTGDGHKTAGTMDEDNFNLMPETDKKRRTMRKGPGRTMGASAINNNVVKKENTIELEQQKTDLEMNTREYSKVLDLDQLAEYKKYYPNNNASKTIAQYNERIRVITKVDSPLNKNIIETHNIKDIYKNIKNNKRSSFMIMNKYNHSFGSQFMTPKSSSNRILKKSGNINFSGSIDSNQKQMTVPSKFKQASNRQLDDDS